jgi:phosphoglucosamine mutase
VRAKPPFQELPAVWQLVEQTEKSLASDGGRLLLRYSGTEPLARLLIEGSDQRQIEGYAKQIAGAIRETIGA